VYVYVYIVSWTAQHTLEKKSVSKNKKKDVRNKRRESEKKEGAKNHIGAEG